jgi:hypothetical protein
MKWRFGRIGAENMRKMQLKSPASKSLWTCTRCRRPFKNRNQAHSCGEFTVEQLLDSKPSKVVELYDRFAALVLQRGEVIVYSSDQDQSSLQGPNRFCDRGHDEELARCCLRAGPTIEKPSHQESPGRVARHCSLSAH